jgi:hypothetical protein
MEGLKLLQALRRIDIFITVNNKVLIVFFIGVAPKWVKGVDLST